MQDIAARVAMAATSLRRPDRCLDGQCGVHASGGYRKQGVCIIPAVQLPLIKTSWFSRRLLERQIQTAVGRPKKGIHVHQNGGWHCCRAEGSSTSVHGPASSDTD